MMRHYDRIGETVYEQRLSNGLLMRVVPKPGATKAHAFLAVDYGSMDIGFSLGGRCYQTPVGVAHYLEHKMFDMPDKNVMQLFSKYGGNPNAFTSYDITAYYVECTDCFEENLKLLLEYVFTPYFTEESVEKERGIIAQEIRMYEDNPDSRVFENLFSSMYESHPIRHSIAGTVESINEITAQTLYDCYGAFYTPGNMMLCVVGDVDPERVFALAEAMSPTDRAERPVRDHGAEEKMSPKRKEVSQRMEVAMPMFVLGFKTEPASHGPASMKQEIIGELASEILVGESSSLYTNLYEKGVIDAGFSCGYEGLKGASLLTASGDSDDITVVRDSILAEAQRIGREGFDEALFTRLKRSSLGRRMRDLDSFDSICYRMCAYEFEGVDYFSFPACFHEVTPQHVLEFLCRTVTEERCALSVVSP